MGFDIDRLEHDGALRDAVCRDFETRNDELIDLGHNTVVEVVTNGELDFLVALIFSLLRERLIHERTLKRDEPTH